MKIQLSQDEIAQAVREYVSKGVTLANGSTMDVDFSMGRGDNGLSATIDVPYMGVATLPVTPAPVAAPSLVAATTANVARSTVVQAEAPKTVDVVVQPNVAAAFAEPAAVPEGTSGEVAVEAVPGKSLFGTPPAQ